MQQMNRNRPQVQVVMQDRGMVKIRLVNPIDSIEELTELRQAAYRAPESPDCPDLPGVAGSAHRPAVVGCRLRHWRAVRSTS